MFDFSPLFSLLLFFSFLYPHLSPYSTFFLLLFFFPFSFHHSCSFPFVLLTYCSLFRHHSPFISFSLSVYVSLCLSPNPTFIPTFIFFISLSLLCLSFCYTTFELLALAQHCNKDVRKFMTPVIPNKLFRLRYVMIRCFLLWKRRQGSWIVTCKARSHKYRTIPVPVQLPNPTTCYTFTLYADIFHPLIKATIMAVMENIRDLIRDQVRPHGCVGKWICVVLYRGEQANPWKSLDVKKFKRKGTEFSV